MAELNIKITTDYKQTQQAFTSVSDNVKKYRNELTKAESVQKAEQKTLDDYINSLTKRLRKEEETKEGMARLNAQAKILKNEIYELNGAFGDGNEVSKHFDKQLDMVKQSMSGLKDTAKKTAKEGIGEIEKTSGNAATKLLSVAKNILKFQLLMGPITAVIRGFKNTISDSMKVAAEAEQRFNKLATVFDGLSKSATSAAKAIASELGVATSTAASALSTVGDLLQAQGMGTGTSLSLSADWVKQFQDIIAFKDLNMSLEEFAQTFMSGAAGNLRNFRTFGSIVKESAVNARLASQGLDTLTGSELELAKMTTRATMALEQQANAMGATEREWDTMLSVNRRLNEAWKEYKENLGDSLNRFIKPAKTWLTELLEYTNDVTRALREINGGEFTIKVRSEGETVETNVIQKALEAARVTGLYNPLPLEITSEQEKNAMKKNSRNGYSVTKIAYSAEEIAAVMKSTGATMKEMQDAAAAGDFILSDENLAKAQSMVQAWKDEDAAIENLKKELISASESADNFIESMASLAHINYTWSDLANIPRAMTFNSETIASGAGEMNGMISRGMSDAISSIYSQLANLNSNVFANPLELAFGLNNPEEDYQAWMDEIMSFYSLLSNRQKQFGDVSDYELERVIGLWGQVNGMLEAYRAEIARPELLAQQTVNRVNANNLMASFRTGIQPTLQATGKYATADTWMANQKSSLRSTEKELLALGIAASEVNAWISEMIPLINEEYQARKDLIDEEEKQKELEEARQKEEEALKYFQDKFDITGGLATAYTTGQEAFGGGIAGGIIGILIEIASKTEAFQTLMDFVMDTVVPIFDAFLKPMLPALKYLSKMVQDILIDIMEPLFEPLKDAMQAIVIVAAVVQTIIETIKWLWNNLNVALHNIGEIIKHPLNKNKQDRWSYSTWDELTATWADIWDDANKTLEEIEGLVFQIEENTDKDDLKTLRELYSRNIINEDQFYAGARVVQKSKVFDPVSPSSNSYATYGNVTIYVNGGDPTELKRTLQEFFNENGMSYNMAYGRA